LTYNGPLSVEEFYGEVKKWMDEKGLNMELKRKSEDIASKGKKIEWIIEAWRHPTHHVKHVIRLRALFDNVKEIRIKKQGRNIKINQANVLIEIDGFIETQLSTQWTNNALYLFFRTLFAKYIWDIGQTETERHEGQVNPDCYDLHKRIKAFFSLYKTKVA